MSRFLDDARAIFEAAESARQSGNAVSDFTMLIGHDGAVQMFAASDWPLDRLLAERRARAAYRVGESNGRIHVEARSASQTCKLESEPPQHRSTRELLFALRPLIEPNPAAWEAAAGHGPAPLAVQVFSASSAPLR